jgi:hypothetical protein
MQERNWSGAFEAGNRDRANLSHAILRGAVLGDIALVGVDLADADLRDTFADDASLARGDFRRADLRGAWLSGDLNGTLFNFANLHGAVIAGSDLTSAEFVEANLREVDLGGADLSGAILIEADLRGADLQFAIMDAKTRFFDVKLDTHTKFQDTVWNGVPLSRVDWTQAPTLGDEDRIRTATSFQKRAQARRAAVRSYHGLAQALRAQGLAMEASGYRLHEQRLERKTSFWSGRLRSWLFSWLMNLVAGYGERPGRALIAYLLAIFGFATAYFFIGKSVGPQLSPLGAFVFSMTSFHGRGFFPGGIALDDPITVLAAFEAFVGLIIEITFIATFTQRFFAR